ncbi:hypothetical protein [Vibrio ponticus]|uniref:hypothetical protein n=1 Tax=Vibrio ponticus TaxID=265668 RepID=UPI0021A52197|nr:hypothetical protein [Vibrio ponticus]
MLVNDLSFLKEVELKIVPIKVTEQGEHYFEIPDEYLEELDWQIGDSVIWTQTKMEAFHLLKKKMSHSNGCGCTKIHFGIS